MALVLVDSKTFPIELENAGDKLVVIHFTASWTTPCKQIEPLFKTFAENEPGLVCMQVDVDASEDIADKYDIQAMPTFLFLRLKEPKGSYVGANIEKLKEKLADV
eukprot:CAMPEP_0115585498 /NCGR_PEP_ID=MMETSP0272-20121206/7225_1 /TAXON_ID=71861 /ORGANISM="Scrippsiella trochoidea, Strain CCMP3099" /LENGTH=104 /DNA_ID=CAMNT_0003020555 /DNA_START=3 /DNA_END=314 /DNA_ORIENTATION=+